MHAQWAVVPTQRVAVTRLTFLIFLTDQPEDGDRTKMVVGVVVGLLVATIVIGLAYWIYMKKAK